MPAIEIPQWAVNFVFIAVCWVLAQVVSEYIKKWMRKDEKWEGSERRQAGSIMIDQETVVKVVKAFEGYTQAMQNLTNEMRASNSNHSEEMERINEIHTFVKGATQ